MSPHETDTLPELQSSPKVGQDPITELRVVGSAAEYSLVTAQRTFTLGSAESCDIPVPNRYLSNLHCVLTRRGNRLRVIDQRSYNGTYFGGERAEEFDIGAGDVFRAGDVTFLALNEGMRLTRAVFEEVIGSDKSWALDELLSTVVKGRQMILLGEAGCDQERLAHAIHRTSLRRHAPVIELSEFPTERAAQRVILDGGGRGMLLLTLRAGMTPPDDAFRSMLLSSDYRVMLCISTPSLAVAVAALGFDVVARSIQIPLPPLRERAGEIPALLDRLLLQRRAQFRFADLRSGNQQALLVHAWPQNIRELHEVADRLVAWVVHESINKAAVALEMPRSSFQYWAERMGLELPLLG